MFDPGVMSLLVIRMLALVTCPNQVVAYYTLAKNMALRHKMELVSIHLTVRRSFHGFNSHSRWQPTPFKRGSSLIRQVEGALVSIHLVNHLNLNVRRSFHGSTTEYYDLWYLLHELIESVTCRTRYPGNNYAFMTFSSPYPRVTDCDILTLAFLRLLENYVYTLDSTYSKVTLGYKMYFPLS